jgi:hypothetical protein
VNRIANGLLQSFMTSGNQRIAIDGAEIFLPQCGDLTTLGAANRAQKQVSNLIFLLATEPLHSDDYAVIGSKSVG